MALMRATPRIVLDLHIRVSAANRAGLFAFLRRAIPYYERPGGIRVCVFEDRADASRLIERIEYSDVNAFDRDQVRVAEDPEMKRWLDEWRGLLEGPPRVRVYSEVPLENG